MKLSTFIHVYNMIFVIFWTELGMAALCRQRLQYSPLWIHLLLSARQLQHQSQRLLVLILQVCKRSAHRPLSQPTNMMYGLGELLTVYVPVARMSCCLWMYIIIKYKVVTTQKIGCIGKVAYLCWVPVDLPIIVYIVWLTRCHGMKIILTLFLCS